MDTPLSIAMSQRDTSRIQGSVGEGMAWESTEFLYRILFEQIVCAPKKMFENHEFTEIPPDGSESHPWAALAHAPSCS